VPTETWDVVVVGAGGAGLRAALAALNADPELRVVVLCKGAVVASGVTATACSDRMAFHATLPTTKPIGADAWRYHAGDIFRLGGYVSDEDLSEILAQESAAAFEYLVQLGVPFARREDGTVDQFLTDGSRYPRACYTGPHTANDIARALLERVRRAGITMREYTLALDVVLSADRDRVCGVSVLPEESQEPQVLSAGAVILATGGAGQIYGTNVFPADCTGDGYAMAFRAGADLVNMEFIQIGLSSVATSLACSGSMFRALPRLVNDVGDEFLARYLPPKASYADQVRLEFLKGASWPVSRESDSHVIDIAVFQERAARRRVYMDFGHNPAGLFAETVPSEVSAWYSAVKGCDVRSPDLLKSPLARLERINALSVEWLSDRGVDLRKGDLVEIAPAAQHFQGGVKIRREADTSLPGLYAAGEAAGGQHGANRPGGNALLDGQVFGHIAGERAAAWARQHKAGQCGETPSMPPVLQSFGQPGGQDAGTVRERLRSVMDEQGSVVRTDEGLRSALAELSQMELDGVQPDDGGLWNAVEVVNLIQVARMVIRAALERHESRGPHLLFSGRDGLIPLGRADPAWRRYIVLSQRGSGMKVDVREPVSTGGSCD
jgi:succinate dehydrogenase/fumarate reductase flavoprotein subunit